MTELHTVITEMDYALESGNKKAIRAACISISHFLNERDHSAFTPDGFDGASNSIIRIAVNAIREKGVETLRDIGVEAR